MLVAALLTSLPACAGRQLDWRTNRSPAQRSTRSAHEESQRGLLCGENGEWEDAAAHFRAAVDMDPGLAAAWSNLGNTYLHTGKYYDAAWAFQTAAKLAPNAIEPKVNLGLLFETVGWRERAVEAYESALRIQPNDETITKHLARAKIQPGARGEPLRDLLDRLARTVRNSTWAEWAREQLARGSGPPGDVSPSDAPATDR